MNNIITKDWDIFDILFAHEDSYTNLLQYLFENSEEFYNNLSYLIFDKKVEKLSFTTRKTYNSESGQKNIPDIIIHNENHLAIIEVKVFANEGFDQTKRYLGCKKEIKDSLKIKSDCIEKFYFLTLTGSKAECDEFSSLTWVEVGKCLPEYIIDNELLALLVSQFKRRVDSLNQKECDRKEKWCDVVKTKYWGGAVGFFSALKMTPSFKQLPNELCDYWASYKKAKNTFTYSALFLPDYSWKGIPVDNKKCTKTNCFELHFEFEWDENSRVLEIRLDYHLNPYKSNKDIERMKNEDEKYSAQLCNSYRYEVAYLSRKEWKKYAPDGWENCYNSKLSQNIMKLIYKEIIIDKNKTVGEVVDEIDKFVSAAKQFTEKEILPKHHLVDLK